MSKYEVRKWDYFNEDRYSGYSVNGTLSDYEIVFTGSSKEDCIKWLKVKYLDLAIKTIEDLDDAVVHIFELDCDRLNYTRTYDSDAYYEYRSTTWVVTCY